ncbi:hypothetical protein M514_07105 [Trichuris suis]|uniref:Sas10 C-terminal domain-containing protein n=1 Tax=Trichuris suis TaxID=68888 RepID=A0A085NPL7_9BILA|nr:hypothetical protein M514_07105 [Trichuris suis]
MRKKSKNAINYSRRRAARTRNAGANDVQEMDSDDLSWINDEVDKYNSDRNEVDLKIYDAEESSESEEEVLPIRLSSDEGEPMDEKSENDNDAQNSSCEEGDDENSDGAEVDQSNSEDEERPDDEEGSSNAAIDSDIEDSEDDDLPDANAWGQKRSAFYNADYAGDEHAGFGSSDEEPAELEEKEAISLQRSLNEWISGVHDEFPTLQMWEDTRKGKKAESSLKEDAVFHVPVDLSAMSSEQILQILKQRSPELVKFIEEYKEKAALMEYYVQFCQLVEKRADKLAIFELARGIFEIIGSYLLNVGFYILMKAKQRDMQGHPVIDRIAQWKEVLDNAFKKWPSFEKDIRSLTEAVKASKRLPEPWSSALHLSIASLRPTSKGSLKRRHSSEESREQDDDEVNETAEISKRSITYEMKKNKGLMPKRKKEQRNPRVKHRNRYRKALKKLRSKRPDVKKEMHRYSDGRSLPPAALENLQEEAMQLKKKICFLSQENVILSTKVKKQESELRRKENEIEQLLEAQKASSSRSNGELKFELFFSQEDFLFIRDGNALLVNSLRQKVVRLERVLRDKEDEIHKLKSNIRSTKLQEAKIEIETLYHEIRRLQSLTRRNSSEMSPAQLWSTEEEKESSTDSRCMDGQQFNRSHKAMNPRSQIYNHHSKTGKNQLNQMSAQLESCVTELEARNVKPKLVDENLSPIWFSPRPSEGLEHGDVLPKKDDEGGRLRELNEAGVGQMKIEDINALIKILAAKLIEEALDAHLERVKHIEMLCDKHFDIESTSLVATEATDHQKQFQNLPDLNISRMEDIISDDDSVKIRALDSSPSLAENLSASSDDEVNMDKREPISTI